MVQKFRVINSYLLQERSKFMPVHRLGRTNLNVSGFGLGGQSLLETPNMQKSAYSLINKALDLGVSYFDTATMYGPSRYYLGQSLGPRRNQVVLASKVRSRDYKGAKKELDESFDLLKTPYIDIIQLHTIENEKDKAVFKKDGALKLLIEAQKANKIGYIGITGHYDPNILIDFMNEYDFDTLLIAINPAIPDYDKAVEKARSKDMGVISMKVMSRGLLPMIYSPEKLLHYAMKRSDVAIVGCSNETDVEKNVLSASNFEDIESNDIEVPEDLRSEIAFFSKEHENKGYKWPHTYQPNWPDIIYESN